MESHLPLAAHYMPRPRIDAILEQATRCKAVYVVAGSGYGKTHAVRSYIEKQPEAVVRWVQLGEHHNLASNYWEHLTHNISLDNPELAVRLREFGFPDTNARFKQFVGILQAAEHRSHKRFLVFDDFHFIDAKPILTFVERCAHLQYPGSCVVIISRKDPEPGIVSLFAKGKASIVTEEELTFTDEEIADFLKFRGIQHTTQRDIHRYSDATKGWALAVQLLSIILKREPKNLELALGAMKQNLFELFESETFEDLPENVQKTLIRSALVSDLPLAPLHIVSEEIASILESSQFASFIWFDRLAGDYRIHPLYLEFLQSKVELLSPEEKIDTYRQAASWCSENNFYTDAMRYFAKSRQYGKILEALLSYPFKLPYDMCEYFLGILEELDESDAGEEKEREKENEKEEKNAVLFLKNHFVPMLLLGMGSREEARDYTLEVIRRWEHPDHSKEPYAANLLYAAYSNLAYMDMYECTVTHRYEAPKYLEKSVEYLKLATVPPVKYEGVFAVADIRSFACLVGEGAGPEAIDRFLEATRQTAVYIEQTPHRMYYGYDDLAACEIAFYKNQLDPAKQHAYRAIMRAREENQYSIEAVAEHYLLRAALAEGDYPLAREALKQLRAHLDNPNFWNRRLMYDLIHGIFCAQIGLPQMSPPWLVADDRETGDEIRIPTRELIVCVKNCIALEKYDRALAILSSSHPREPQERFLLGELVIALLTAVARAKTGDAPGAAKDLERAYSLSFGGVFEMPFVECGKNLHPLAVAASTQADCAIPGEWLKKMDRKASVYAKKAAVIKDSYRAENKMADSVRLSERELEVLHDLYFGLTRDEIAESRYLSLATVNKLFESIYLKLDAKNSMDAIRIAIKNNLITD